MASADKDESGDPFVNVGARTGATGAGDDLLAVQGMLRLIYDNNPSFRKSCPFKGTPTVTGKPAKDTPVLIAHFQRLYLKRAKPEGYVNPAKGTDVFRFTIYRISLACNMVLAALKYSGDIVKYLSEKYPLLAPSLGTPTPPTPAAPSQREREPLEEILY